MINKAAVQQAVEEWLEGKDYFLVDVEISADVKRAVEILQNQEEYNQILGK